jgi:hypothetical protein
MADLSVTGMADQNVKVGETATFEVTVTGGTEPYKYTWKKGPIPLPVRMRPSGRW